MKTITHFLAGSRRAWLRATAIFLTISSFIVVGAATFLNAHGEASDVIHVCVKDSSGRVRVVEPGQSCKNNWTRLHLQSIAVGDLPDAIATTPEGGRLDLACGVYPVDQAISILKSLHISGASRQCVIIQAAASHINLFNISAAGVTFENVTLMGDGTTSGVNNGNLITLSGEGDFAVRNTLFLNWGQDAVRLVETAGTAKNIRIESSAFIGGQNNPGFQHDIAFVGSVENVWITHNVFSAHETMPAEFSIFMANSGDRVPRNIIISDNHISGQYGRSCIAISDETPNGTLRVHTVTITGNIIQNCLAQAIHLKNVPRHIVSGNRIYDVNSVGIGGGLDGDITINGSLQGSITGNSITGGRVGVVTTEIPNPMGDPLLDDGFNISGNVIKNASSDGIRLSTGTRGAVISGNTILDCGDGGVAIRSQAAIRDITIDGNIMRGCKFGVATIGPIVVRPVNLLISNNVIAQSSLSGLQLREIENSMIVDNLISESGTGANLQSGINLTMSDGVFIAGNVIGGQDRGISLGGGTANIEIINNDLRNNLLDSIVNAQVAAVVRDNIGFVTENSETAILPAGNTLVVVNHGLDLTPDLEDVQLTPQGPLGAAAQFWVAGANAATLTIAVDSPPGVNVLFSWRAVID